MRVLIVGSGGREHALAWKVSQSPLKPEIYCAPGNAGTRQVATNVDLPVTSIGALAIWAVEHQIDLTIVGPEVPLAEGIIDVFTEHGLRAFGPTKAAAKLEASKSFAKEVMLKAGVNTARGKVFEDFESARDYVTSEGAPIVIKADGLAAGKGVVVAKTVDEAIAALNEFMLSGTHGESGRKVVVEECLVGEEASVIALVDGTTVLPLVVSQDYKRVFDGDEGPNTGGMGAISPTAVLGERRVETIVGEVFLPVIRELLSRGIKYTGFLYAGILVDRSGSAKVLEFNCRLGDPETQVLMMRLSSDLLPVISAALDNRLASVELQWRPDAAVCIVAASKGYPGNVEDGQEISGLIPGDRELQVFHSGTVNDEEGTKVISRGGRILTVTALGEDQGRAASKAYAALKGISFDGMHFRNDIGGAVNI